MKGQAAGVAVEEEELPPPSSLTFSTCDTFFKFQWFMGCLNFCREEFIEQVVRFKIVDTN